MPEVTSTLEDLGLSEKEVSVYLALLQLGEETASRVSEIANLNRVTTYALLKSLQEKGFCSILNKNNVQYFKPTKPEHILGLLEEKKNKVKVILPLLKEKERIVSEKPEVGLFEGKKGIVALFDIILKNAEKTKNIFAYGNFTITEKIIEYESLHWRKTRIAKKIKNTVIIDALSKNRLKDLKEEQGWKSLSELRINPSLSKINAYVIMTEELVAYFAFKGELSAVLIKNKEIAQKERFNFNMLWEQSNK